MFIALNHDFKLAFRCMSEKKILSMLSVLFHTVKNRANHISKL